MNRPSPDDMKAMQVMEYIEELEEGNKELKEENKRLQSVLDYANRDREDMHNKIIELWNKRESQRNMNYKLRKENKKLKEDNRFLTKISKEYMKKENIIEVAEFTELYKDDLEKENKELKAENKELKMKLEHYENTKAIQESNDASRWKPWCMSYVDRELNVIR